MKLLIDIGNTSIKWATFEDGALAPMRSARHFGALPIDVIASWEHLSGVDRLLLASVGPETVKDGVAKAVDAYWQCPVHRVRTSAQAHGVRVAYADPARLGVDRFLAMIGAYTLLQPMPSGEIERPGCDRSQRASEAGATPTAVLVIDAGTAITFDAVAANGDHLGGHILPGISTLRSSLLNNTNLPPHHIQDHAQPWGQDTGPAIAAASLQAPAALAERLAQRLQLETGLRPRVFLTGGDAERLAPFLENTVVRCDNLVLRGLTRYA